MLHIAHRKVMLGQVPGPFSLKFWGGCRNYISTSNPGNCIQVNHLMSELLERIFFGGDFSSFRVAQSRYLHIVHGGER